VAEAVAALSDFRRPRLVDIELAAAREEIAAALTRAVRKRERHKFRHRLNQLHIPGSAGRHSSFGALVRERQPVARRSVVVERDGVLHFDEVLEVARNWVDEVLDLIAAVEGATTLAAEDAAWEALREWSWFNSRWRRPKKKPKKLSGEKPARRRGGPRRRIAYFIAAQAAAEWLVMHHRGWDGQLDGRLPGVELKQVLEGLGWQVNYSPRTLRVELKKFERKQPTVTGTPPVGWRPVRRGRLLFFVPPAERCSARRGKGR